MERVVHKFRSHAEADAADAAADAAMTGEEGLRRLFELRRMYHTRVLKTPMATNPDWKEFVALLEVWAGKVIGDFGGVPANYIGRAELLRNKLATGRPKDAGDAAKLARRVAE